MFLLSELDAGMARTQNLDTTRAIARDLGAGHAFGVEFVELGLGDTRSNGTRPVPTTNAGSTAMPS